MTIPKTNSASLFTKARTAAFALAAAAGFSACEDDPVKGACVVEAGGDLQACAVVNDKDCTDTMTSGNMFSPGRKVSFTAGKQCKDSGFAVGGCPNVSLMWSFDQRCPM